jgi:hypothetical protein
MCGRGEYVVGTRAAASTARRVHGARRAVSVSAVGALSVHVRLSRARQRVSRARR